MKYLVVSKRADNPSDFTICASLSNQLLAERLKIYYHRADHRQICEIHPVMEDAEVEQLLDDWASF